MKKRLMPIFFMSIILPFVSIDSLKGKGQKLVRSEDVQNGGAKLYSKETEKKVKATIVQCKKQFSRLFDLLAEANCLEKEGTGLVYATRDLRDFLDNLGAIYTHVVDKITGRDELKKQIEELKKINTHIFITMQEQQQELNNRDALEKNLTHLLVAERDAHSKSLDKIDKLEVEKLAWLSILNRLENCSKELTASIALHNHEKSLIEEALSNLP